MEQKKYWCKFCNKFVTKSAKYYTTSRGKIFDKRSVCSGGCNTDWKDIVWENNNTKS